MKDYANGKIYTIQENGNVLYVGATTLTLKRRYQAHRHKAPGREIVLYENFPCANRAALDVREEEVRRWLDPPLNMIRASFGATAEDRRQRRRELDIKRAKTHLAPKMCECGRMTSAHNEKGHRTHALHKKCMVMPHLKTSLARRIFLRNTPIPQIRVNT